MRIVDHFCSPGSCFQTLTNYSGDNQSGPKGNTKTTLSHSLSLLSLSLSLHNHHQPPFPEQKRQCHTTEETHEAAEEEEATEEAAAEDTAEGKQPCLAAGWVGAGCRVKKWVAVGERDETDGLK